MARNLRTADRHRLPALVHRYPNNSTIMRTIYKYPIKITDEQEIPMPADAEVLHVGLDPQGTPCLWAMVETDKPVEPVSVLVFGTGGPVAFESLRHVGSFVQISCVWHVFLG